MRTPEDYTRVQDFEAGRTLGDEQYRALFRAVVSGREAMSAGAAADMRRHAPPAGWAVLCRAHRLLTAASVASSGLPVLGDGVRQFSRIPHGRCLESSAHRHVDHTAQGGELGCQPDSGGHRYATSSVKLVRPQSG